MSALDDIKATLKAAPAPKEGHKRAVLVGISAQRALACDCQNGLPLKIAGVDVHRTDDFDGWDIADRRGGGRWRSVERAKA